MSKENDKKPYEEMTPDELVNTASEKLKIDIDWARSVNYDDILYLLNQYPFLQIVNTEISEVPPEFNIIKANSGWNIHDYGDAISSSPGQLMYNGSDKDGRGIINPNKGTIINQAFQTAAEMVELAKKHGWVSIQVVDGHPIMERACWIKATELGLTVEDFTPSHQDRRVQKLVNLAPDAMETWRHELQQN